MPSPEPGGRRPRALADWLALQEQLHPRSVELGLGRVQAVASALDLLADRRCTLTIGGTNGKGSSVALAERIYRAAGYRVGAYYSPHLLRYNERVVIDGEPVSDAALCRAFEAVDQARDGCSLTYFEFGTLAALWLFREADVQVRVLEVGLGGRLDAVNVVDADCALITNIGMDHTDWLGTTREAIGTEKAGILRAQGVAICADPDPPASVLQRAQALQVDLRCAGRDYRWVAQADRWTFEGRSLRVEALPWPGLQGQAQLHNAAGVLAAVEALLSRLPISAAAMHEALPRLYLPGRFERRGQVILDVAHNAEAAQTLAANLLASTVAGQRWLILGMLADKPVGAVIAALSPACQHLCLAGLPGPRGLTAMALQERAGPWGADAERFADVPSAFASVRGRVQPEDEIVICGSFLTVAAVAAAL